LILIFSHFIHGQSEVFSNPLSSSTKSSTLFENIGQSLIGKSTSSGITLLEGFGYLLDTSTPSVTLTIDHPDLIVSYADGPITVQATFASAQSATPTLVYTDFGGTTSLTMDVVSGTTDRKQWDYDISFSGPDEQKLLTVGSSSVTVTFDSMPSQIYSTEVNQEGTAVDVIFTEDLFASYISNVATGTVSITDFSLTLSSTTASLTSSTPTSMSVASTTLTDGKIYNLGFSFNGTASVGDVLSVGVSTDTYDIAGNAVSSSLTSNTATYKVSETTEEVTLKLTSNSSSTDLTNCDDIKFTATFNTDVSSPVILQITDSSTTTYQLGMTPVTSTASSSLASDSTFTTWEANWSATASYSIGSLTMTISHTGAQVISTTNTSTLAKLEFNLTDNDAVCGVSSPTLTIDHPDLIVSYADGPITVQATFASAQSATPTLVYTDFGGTTSLTMDVVSGTTDRKQWDYDISFSGPDEQKLLTVGSSSVTVTFDSMPSQIYSTEVNQEGTAVDVIFTEDLFASYISNVATGTVSITDFSLTLSSTTASLTSSTPTSMSVASTTLTDGKIYNLGFSFNGTASVGDVLSVGVSTDTYDIAGNAVSSSLTSNTATYKVSETTEEVTLKLTSNSSSTDLTNCDDIKFTATFNTDVSSPVILQITDSSTTTYQLGMTPVTSTASSSLASDSTFTTWEANWSATASYSIGSLTMTISHTGAQVISTTNTSTLAKLEFNLTDNDKLCDLDTINPEIAATLIDESNKFVDIAFSEGVYAQISPTTAITSSSLVLNQLSGSTVSASIIGLSASNGSNLVPGESEVRVFIQLGDTYRGGEVFSLTAVNSSSIVDLAGNAMTVSQTNNTFTLNSPVSGGVSTETSVIRVEPQEFIANGINTAVITVQAKNSLGQNFLDGGGPVIIYGPDGDLETVDNQDGTYSVNYTPDKPESNSYTQVVTFGFSVANISSSATASVTIHRDNDDDGVFDSIDECLDTEPGLEVDEKGCALNQLDSDNDGVFDDVDECPDTPEFEINNIIGTENYGELIATVVDEKGCGASQTDTDDDGIFDDVDNCIEEPNPDQLDTDGDGIGDVCDTDNPLPEIDFTPISIVEKPENGTIVGTVNAVDPDGETVSYTLVNGLFTGILSIDSVTGALKVENGSGLTLNSQYNGSLVEVIVSDGTNEINASVELVILEAPKPPEIIIVTFEVSEDVEVGTLVGVIEVSDPMGGSIVSTELSGDGYLELVDSTSSTLINTVGGRVVKEIRTVQELDYEELTEHQFTITATSSGFEEIPSLTASNSESVRVVDIPNTSYTGRFFISIFNVQDENLGAKVDHRRYFNPHQKSVGKWKVKKKIKGGADADKFTIKSRKATSEQKNDDPIEDENEDYLDFITPPDFENPGDANKDNVYEVEVEYINTDDGAPEVPIVVTQTQIQVPEGKSTTIQLQSQPVLPTDDNDGDGVVDILDNSPLVANPDQSDEDGDGVGDVTDDADHDGVWNPFDSCPDTPLGELVDLDGCLIYYLPASNFSISKTEKCAGENSITLSVEDATVDYVVSVSGATSVSESFSSSNWSIDSLSAGVYTVCVSVEGVNPLEFERCFEVTIEEPDPLLVSSLYNKENQTVSFDLSGGSTYQITHNGKTTQTNSSKYAVSLEKGINNISISTGIECQGLFQNSYLNSYEVKYAPNPFREVLQLYIGGQDNLIEIGVYASNGQLIDYKTISLPFGIRNYTLDTGSYKQGVYIIKVKGQTLDQSIQVIKE
jgi:hypothetical protein